MGGQKIIALVIGWGSVKWAAALGLLRVLNREGIEVDRVVGSGGGSVLGAAIALGFNADQLMDTRAKAWTDEITKKISFGSLFKIIFPKLSKFSDQIGIFDDSIMARNIEKAFGSATIFVDTLIPFHCIAIDFQTGETCVMSDGLLDKAVWISSGIPVIFTPIDWNGKLHIEGGFSNPLPVDVAVQQGADIIAVGFETPLTPSIASPGQLTMQMSAFW